MREKEPASTGPMTRLAVCAVVAVAVIYAGEKLCTGKNWAVWEKYGPWILENRVEAIAILAAVLYGVSLALWPEKEEAIPTAVDGFEPC